MPGYRVDRNYGGPKLQQTKITIKIFGKFSIWKITFGKFHIQPLFNSFLPCLKYCLPCFLLRNIYPKFVIFRHLGPLPCQFLSLWAEASQRMCFPPRSFFQHFFLIFCIECAERGVFFCSRTALGCCSCPCTEIGTDFFLRGLGPRAGDACPQVPCAVLPDAIGGVTSADLPHAAERLPEHLLQGGEGLRHPGMPARRVLEGPSQGFEKRGCMRFWPLEGGPPGRGGQLPHLPRGSGPTPGGTPSKVKVFVLALCAESFSYF